MARDGFAPEIKAAMGDSPKGRLNKSPRKESPADMQRDAKRGIKEGSAQDTKLDAMPANQAPQRPRPPMQAMPGVQNCNNANVWWDAT